MFGRDALTNLKHLISPKLRYMGTRGVDSGPQDNVKHLPVTDSQPQVGQTMCHRRSKASPLTQTSILVDLVLVRDHTSKSFMSKYKTDYHVIRVLGNKVEVKDNNGKMSWFHISDVKKN